MAVAAGSTIKEAIGGKWSLQVSDTSTIFNVSLLKAGTFGKLTWIPPPLTPVAAKACAKYGYLFFDLSEAGSKGCLMIWRAWVVWMRLLGKSPIHNAEETVDSWVVKVANLKSTFVPAARNINVTQGLYGSEGWLSASLCNVESNIFKLTAGLMWRGSEFSHCNFKHFQLCII